MKRLDVHESETGIPPTCPTCSGRMVYRSVPPCEMKPGLPSAAWRCSGCRSWWTEGDVKR